MVDILDSNGSQLEFLEQSNGVLTIAFKDSDGVAVEPASITWSLYRTNNDIVNSLLDQSETPGTSITILFSGDDLQVYSGKEDYKRIFLAKWTYTESGEGSTPGRYIGKFNIVPTESVVT